MSMEVLIITSRKYYGLFYSEYWSKMRSNHIINYLMNLPNNSYAKENCVSNFFIKEKEDANNDDDAYIFWSKETPDNIEILKRNLNDNCIVYIVPCIPKYHYSKESPNGLCRELKEKQDFIGNVIHAVLDDFAPEVVKKCTFRVLAHDMDLFTNSSERFFIQSDLNENSELAKLIDGGVIAIGNIYGYQHVSFPPKTKVYKLIKSEFAKEQLPSDLLQQIIERMEIRK